MVCKIRDFVQNYILFVKLRTVCKTTLFVYTLCEIILTVSKIAQGFFSRSIWKNYPQLKITILALVVTFIRYGNMIIYYTIKAT